MTYQPKSYRKFLATAATATLVASAVAVPFASAASFTDVSSKYETAVNYLVDNNITSGLSATQFGVSKEIKRVDAAVMIAKALKLDTTSAPDAGFKDVPARAQGAVNALVNAKVLSGKTATTFGSNDSLTRGEFAIILSRAYNLSGEGQDLKFTDVSSRYADAVKALVKNEITSGKSATSFGTSDAIKRGDFAIFVHKAATLNVAPEVVGVSAINATQVEVKFNQEVDKTTVETEANYKVDDTTLLSSVGTAELQEDGKTVIITFASSKNKTSFTLETSGLKTKDLKDVEDYSGTVYVNDVAAPTVKNTEFQANGDLVINFNEPLSAVDPIVRVAGKPVSFASVSTGATSITLTAAALSSAGVSVSGGESTTVYVAGAKDTVGNEMAIYNGTATKGSDSEKPYVTSISQLGQNKLKVVFSEALGASASDLAVGEFKFLKGSTVYSSSAVTKDTNDTSNRTYEVTFSASDIYGSSNPVDTQAVTLLLDKNAVKDGYGNGNDAISQSFTFNTDKTAPKFVSSKVSDDKQTFELTFDEDFVGTTAGVDESKIVITDADGVRYNALDTTTVVKAGASNSKVLVVDFVASTGTIENGTYKVTVQAGAIKDAQNNSNEAFTTTVNVGDASDTTKPVATLDVTTTPDTPVSGENKFVVDYSEEVGSSALSLANYKLDGDALPTGTVIYFNSTAKDSVTIELPENVYNIGTVGTGTNALLNVSNVADKAGNKVDSTNLTVKVSDNTSAKLQTVQVVGNDILLTFDEAIDSTTATAINTVAKLAADFDITVDGEDLDLGTVGTTSATGDGTPASVSTSLVSGNSKQVKISLTPAVGDSTATDNVASNWDPTKPVTVKVNGATLKDKNLYLLSEGTAVSK